jgi:hypothetical protein
MKTLIAKTAAKALMVLVGVAGTAAAQRYLSEEAAGEIYNIQGEYTGMVGAKKYGIQVITWGGNSYEAVILPGGLPGDGWGTNPADFKSVRGTTSGTNTVFNTAPWSFVIPKGGATLAGRGPDGDIKMNKVFRESRSLGWAPPAGAKVLFDGTTQVFRDNWTTGSMVNNMYLGEGTETKSLTFTDHHLHIEFRPPLEPLEDFQGRGNSGVYVQGRYEVQVLDSFAWMKGTNHGGADGWAGGIYATRPADFNMSLPPLRWQTYDIYMTNAKFSGSTKTANARITVFHNGVMIHNDFAIPGTTPGNYRDESSAGGILALQNHGGPMWYRNIWALPGTNFAQLPAAGPGKIGGPVVSIVPKAPHAAKAAILASGKAAWAPRFLSGGAWYRADGTRVKPALTAGKD